MVSACSCLNDAVVLPSDHADYLQQEVTLKRKILQNITRDLQVELAENMFIKDGLRERLLARAIKKKGKEKMRKNTEVVWPVQLSSISSCSFASCINAVVVACSWGLG